MAQPDPLQEELLNKAPEGVSTVLLAEHASGHLLETVAQVAVGTLRHVSAASVSLLTETGHGFETVGASSEAVRGVDGVQYESGGGPCVHAIRSGSEVSVSIPSDEWPSFSAAAEKILVRSVWSLPLRLEDRVTGSLNLYSRESEVWDDLSADAARLLARHTADLLSNAAALARTELANATLRKALETRTVIGQAQGVLMARQHINSDEAFDILRRASQRTNRKLRDVAAEIVAGVGSDRSRPDPAA